MERQIAPFAPVAPFAPLPERQSSASANLFNEYLNSCIHALRAGRANDLFAAEKQYQNDIVREQNPSRKAELLRDEAVIEIAFAEQSMRDHGNPYFALYENEHARENLKKAEFLEPNNTKNQLVDGLLHASFNASTLLPEFQIVYPGGFPIDTGNFQPYHHPTPAPRVRD